MDHPPLQLQPQPQPQRQGESRRILILRSSGETCRLVVMQHRYSTQEDTEETTSNVSHINTTIFQLK